MTDLATFIAYLVSGLLVCGLIILAIVGGLAIGYWIGEHRELRNRAAHEAAKTPARDGLRPNLVLIDPPCQVIDARARFAARRITSGGGAA